MSKTDLYVRLTMTQNQNFSLTLAELTDSATWHGGQDLHGGRGPLFTNEGICLSVTMLPVFIYSRRPTTRKFISRTGQEGHTICGDERKNKRRDITVGKIDIYS